MSRREALQATAGAVAFAALPLPAGAAADSTATPALPTHTLPLEVTVNGRVHQLVVDPRLSVLDMLRERLSLTGTKKGCNQGACGACTVLIDGRRVNACLALAVMHDGAKITTIEGVAEGEALHPLQEAFIEHDAFQCGYCTSGQIMSGLGCISEGHASSAEEISYWMSGNICRCGAYPGIVAAVAQAAKEDRT
jgi:xanthine dehydrogenase YagT iron-sulfur-binding subunit